jgi:hypothetical protein
MKRFVFPLVLGLILLGVSSQAMLAEVGLKGGIIIANVNATGEISGSLSWKSVNGLIIGGFASIRVNDYFFLQPEIYYSQKGTKFEELILGVKYRDELKLDYVEIPVLAKFRLITKGNVFPSLFAGPYAAFKLSAKEEQEIAGVKETDDAEGVKSSDFGLVFGGSIDIKVGKMALILDVRYDLGLAKILDEEGESMKNNAFIAMVGIGF